MVALLVGHSEFVKKWWQGAFSLFVIKSLLLLFTVVIFSLDCAAAAIYACRDSSGKIHYTNVRNDQSCRPHTPANKTKGAGRWGWSKKSSAPKSAKSAKYDQVIEAAARRHNIDPPLIKAIIHTESDFNHLAVSKAGAQGLMQLMPGTARELRVADPFNPYQNIDGGSRYFRQMLDDFNGNLILSLAAYNAGPGLVKRTGGVPKIQETRRYINRVLRRYKYYKASW